MVVTTEVGYCNFCGRPRNLRREDHQLGTLVRSIVTCETCHRTLSSTVGVASAEAAAEEKPAPGASEDQAVAAPKPKAAAKKQPAAKPATRKPAAKPKAPTKASKPAVKKTTTKSAAKKSK